MGIVFILIKLLNEFLFWVFLGFFEVYFDWLLFYDYLVKVCEVGFVLFFGFFVFWFIF